MHVAEGIGVVELRCEQHRLVIGAAADVLIARTLVFALFLQSDDDVLAVMMRPCGDIDGVTVVERRRISGGIVHGEACFERQSRQYFPQTDVKSRVKLELTACPFALSCGINIAEQRRSIGL